MERDDLVRKIKGLAKEAFNVETKASDISDDLHGLLQRLEEGSITLELSSATHDRRRKRQRNTSVGRDADRILWELAQSGVGKLVITRLAGGAATVTVEDRPSVRLPAALADLLEAICSNMSQGDDGLMGYKSLVELALLLEKKRNKRLTPHAITQNIYRLRLVLQTNGNNPYLIQTTRNGGVRLALKKGATVVISDDHT